MSAADANAPVIPKMKATRLSSRYSWLRMVAPLSCRGKTAGMLLSTMKARKAQVSAGQS